MFSENISHPSDSPPIFVVTSSIILGCGFAAHKAVVDIDIGGELVGSTGHGIVGLVHVNGAVACSCPAGYQGLSSVQPQGHVDFVC